MINLDADAWGSKSEKSCITCKHNMEYSTPQTCGKCNAWDGAYYNWEAKEEPDHLKGEFYVKLVCDINGTEVEISETKLNDFVKNIAAEVTESILNNLKGENLEQ